ARILPSRIDEIRNRAVGVGEIIEMHERVRRKVERNVFGNITLIAACAQFGDGAQHLLVIAAAPKAHAPHRLKQNARQRLYFFHHARILSKRVGERAARSCACKACARVASASTCAVKARAACSCASSCSHNSTARSSRAASKSGCESFISNFEDK